VAFFRGVVVVVGMSGGVFRDGDPACDLREEPFGLGAATRDGVEVGCAVACAGFVGRDPRVAASSGLVAVDEVAVADDLPVVDDLLVVDDLAARDGVVTLPVAGDLWRLPAEPRALTGCVAALVDVVIELVVVDSSVVGVT
jgi:hypothetical protein